MRHRPLANRNTRRDKLVKETIENEQSLGRQKEKITYILIFNVLPIKSERANAPERLEDFVE